ncbi:hypothetical protein DRO54_11560 [Candidatus Bathyarchaeota archaeon]|nr:MAG: hypothetical protein DRO54_11560 [Candidatus Bathyarchaeota archaeon]
MKTDIENYAHACDCKVTSIAVIHPRFKIGGGVDRVIYEVSKRLNQYGFDITVYATDIKLESHPCFKVQSLKNLRNFSYSTQLLYTLAYMQSNPQKFKDYTLLWIHSVPLTVPALHIKQLYNTPVFSRFTASEQIWMQDYFFTRSLQNNLSKT